MKALVTGGTGFVGSHIVRVLNAAGHHAVVLHRQSSKLQALDGLAYQSAIGDILDEASLAAACQDCDWVFHVAAVADYWRADPNHMFEVNIEGTRRVLNAARAAGVKRVVFTSSAAALGLRDDGQPSDESLSFNLPQSRFPYGYSKHLAEQVVKDAVAAGQDIVTVNPVVILGPGDLNMISGSFITHVKRLGPLVPVTSGGIAIIDVRDVARMHLAAAERGRSGERYILTTANLSQRDLLGMIADVVGVRRPFLPTPSFIVSISAALIDLARALGVPTPIDSNQARLGVRNIFFDGRKAWAEFGPPQIDMRQSVRDTYDWYRQNGYL
jgi:dihydroflavonol-4-reductase